LRKRGDANAEHHLRNHRWTREHPGQRDEAWFKREIARKLDAFTLAEIAAATALSLAACSRIRAGVKLPHPRHWQTLKQLLGGEGRETPNAQSMATQLESSPPESPRPTGTVTFLFSDIEGSTMRWERDRDAMATALARHDARCDPSPAGSRREDNADRQRSYRRPYR
jgi:hypothetical protein